MKNAVYKMIDFSKEEGHLFISIKHNCKNNRNVILRLICRNNINNIIELPIKKYGFHLEVSINVDDIFNTFKINKEQVWDICLYDNYERIDIDLENFQNFMTDYYPMKEYSYIVKPYVTGLNTIALFIKKDKI